jgi:hypothetical protein
VTTRDLDIWWDARLAGRATQDRHAIQEGPQAELRLNTPYLAIPGFFSQKRRAAA